MTILKNKLRVKIEQEIEVMVKYERGNNKDRGVSYFNMRWIRYGLPSNTPSLLVDHLEIQVLSSRTSDVDQA